MRKKVINTFVTILLTTITSILIYFFVSHICKNTRIEEDNSSPFDQIIGGLLDEENPDYSTFSNLINALAENDKAQYEQDISTQFSTLQLKSLSNVEVESVRSTQTPYKGIFVNDVRDARWILANIDKVKSVGFDTLFVNVHLEVDPDIYELHIPKEVYLFYLKAFSKSGFRIWLALAHSSYDFPYRGTSENERIGIPPLENQLEILDMITPFVYEWAKISEEHNFDTFIPLEEANGILTRPEHIGHSYLCKPEREALGKWVQEILPGIKNNFSGNIAFASNEGEFCENIGSTFHYGINYSGYDFLVFKIPFPSIFENNYGSWIDHMDSSISQTLPIINQNSLQGVLYYEVGDTVGKALNEDFAGMLPVQESTEEFQKESYEKDFLLLSKNDKILGLFFKISDISPNEPEWNPFDRPAEDVIKENFAQETLSLTETDKIWIEIGEEGLKIIQICLSDKMPFDPEYILDYALTEEGDYHKLEETVKGICRE